MSIVLFFEYSDADFEPMATKKQTSRPAIKWHQYKRQNGFDPNADPYGSEARRGQQRLLHKDLNKQNAV